MISENLIIRLSLLEFRRYVKDMPDWEWCAIGDCWLEAWNVAMRLEKERGIYHQKTLRLIVNEIMPPKSASRAAIVGPTISKGDNDGCSGNRSCR